ncbi:MAG: hypothetical protein HOP31_12965 [Ignavibacteria bacterium]|nr:hypothetical protein [Ignavibacteria bacterium]
MTDKEKEATSKKPKTVELEQNNKYTLISKQVEDDDIEEVENLIHKYQPDFPVTLEKEVKITIETKYDKQDECIKLYITYQFKDINIIETKQLKLIFPKAS